MIQSKIMDQEEKQDILKHQEREMQKQVAQMQKELNARVRQIEKNSLKTILDNTNLVINQLEALQLFQGEQSENLRQLTNTYLRIRNVEHIQISTISRVDKSTIIPNHFSLQQSVMESQEPVRLEYSGRHRRSSTLQNIELCEESIMNYSKKVINEDLRNSQNSINKLSSQKRRSRVSIDPIANIHPENKSINQLSFDSSNF